jgi:hypothetical protein
MGLGDRETVIVRSFANRLEPVRLVAGKSYRLIVDPARLKLRLHNAERKPLGNVPYRIRSGKDTLAEGRADGDGFVIFPMPPFCPERLKLEWGEDPVFPFAFQLNIVPDCSSGSATNQTIAKLNNLGYSATSDLESALQQFQVDYEVDHLPGPLGLVSGELPAETREMLDKLFAEANEQNAAPF